jgi:hypothetical protein
MFEALANQPGYDVFEDWEHAYESRAHGEIQTSPRCVLAQLE